MHVRFSLTIVIATRVYIAQAHSHFSILRAWWPIRARRIAPCRISKLHLPWLSLKRRRTGRSVTSGEIIVLWRGLLWELGELGSSRHLSRLCGTIWRIWYIGGHLTRSIWSVLNRTVPGICSRVRKGRTTLWVLQMLLQLIDNTRSRCARYPTLVLLLYLGLWVWNSVVWNGASHSTHVKGGSWMGLTRSLHKLVCSWMLRVS